MQDLITSANANKCCEHELRLTMSTRMRIGLGWWRREGGRGRRKGIKKEPSCAVYMGPLLTLIVKCMYCRHVLTKQIK